MKSFSFLILFFLLGNAGLAGAEIFAGTPDGPYNQLVVNGEVVANEISKATGCAISPILGISVLGAYIYYTTPAAERHQVPWHARPGFWVPLLIVLLGIIVKDSSKIALPKIILVPLDAIETLLEKNTSAVLALIVVLTSLTGRGIEQLHLFAHSLFPFLPSAAYAAEGLAQPAVPIAAGVVELGFLFLLLTVVYGVVWVVSQSLNFLILLCPFSSIDLLLTLMKNSLVALLLGAYLVHPFAGLLVACVIILISLVLFSRSYRFVVFGTLFSYDLLRRKTSRPRPDLERIQAFAGPGLTGVPSLSLGSIRRVDDALEFRYRPWLVLSARTATAPASGETYLFGKAMLSPVILREHAGRGKHVALCRLRPQYAAYEAEIVHNLALNGVCDVTFGKTMRDGFRWLRDQLSWKTETDPNPRQIP